jgi:predicted RNA-binding Zn-ribbon protein involved in translation (DUF1610 family)
MSTDRRLPVECASCGWQGRRKPGNVVQCPRCGGIAAFQVKDER